MGLKMQYNWPDRIKLILVNTVLNTILGVIIAMFILFQDVAKQYFTSLKQIFLVGILLAVLLTLPFFLKEWKKLRNQEKAGELPDMKDMRNITGRQMIFLAIGAPLFVTSFVLFQFDYKPAAALCFISFLVLGAVEKAYVKRRYKRIKEGNSSE